MKILLKNILYLKEKGGLFTVDKKDILINHNRIERIDSSISEENIAQIIDGKNKLVIPGLVNSHTHSYMSLFRNHADDLAFSDWLFKNILPLEDKLTPEDAYWGSLLAISEMISTGTTSFVDMYMFIDKTCKAVEESGIRGFMSRGLVGDGNDSGGFRRLGEAKNEIKDWKNRCDRIKFLLAPHAPYSCSQKYLSQIAEEADQLNLSINIHLSESRNEYKDIKEKYKMSPTEYVEETGIFTRNTLAAHCVHMSDSDIEILRRHSVNVVTNPISNMKLANGFAPISKFQNSGINLCIGTDGAASNNTLDMVKEMQVFSLIHKGVNEDSQMLSANRVFEMATKSAAKALNVSEDIGLISVGMKADLSIVNIDKPNMYPHSNLISSLVYSMSGNDVETVIVDGKIIMKNKEFLTLDIEKIKYKANEIYTRISK